MTIHFVNNKVNYTQVIKLDVILAVMYEPVTRSGIGSKTDAVDDERGVGQHCLLSNLLAPTDVDR